MRPIADGLAGAGAAHAGHAGAGELPAAVAVGDPHRLVAVAAEAGVEDARRVAVLVVQAALARRRGRWRQSADRAHAEGPALVRRREAAAQHRDGDHGVHRERRADAGRDAPGGRPSYAVREVRRQLHPEPHGRAAAGEGERPREGVGGVRDSLKLELGLAAGPGHLQIRLDGVHGGVVHALLHAQPSDAAALLGKVRAPRVRRASNGRGGLAARRPRPEPEQVKPQALTVVQVERVVRVDAPAERRDAQL